MCMLGCDSYIHTAHTAEEKRAIEFVESMYEGDAEKFVDMMLDSIIDNAIKEEGIATKELYVYELDKLLDLYIDEFKSRYGKKWKYKISVIDSYTVESPEELSEYEITEVFLKVEHSGKKFFFFKVNDSEEIKVQVTKKGNKWYVITWLRS